MGHREYVEFGFIVARTDWRSLIWATEHMWSLVLYLKDRLEML